MLLLHMQEMVFVDSQEGLLSSRGGGGGGGRHTGTRLTPRFNRIHHIPVATLIVSIKTNTIPIITIKSITFSIVFWAGFYCFFQHIFDKYSSWKVGRVVPVIRSAVRLADYPL